MSGGRLASGVGMVDFYTCVISVQKSILFSKPTGPFLGALLQVSAFLPTTVTRSMSYPKPRLVSATAPGNKPCSSAAFTSSLTMPMSSSHAIMNKSVIEGSLSKAVELRKTLTSTRPCCSQSLWRVFTQLQQSEFRMRNRRSVAQLFETHRGFVFRLRAANFWNNSSNALDFTPGCALIVCAVSLSYSSHCSQPPGSFALHISPQAHNIHTSG